MKKKWLLFFISTAFWHAEVSATTLMQVYNDALCSDPIYQQAIAQRLANREAFPISLSSLLPYANVTYTPGITKSNSSGSATSGGNATTRGNATALVLTQTIFNYASFAGLAGAQSIAKQADATMNAQVQDLMIRVSKTYFKILQDQDVLRASESNKKSFGKQLEQIDQQYKVGLKTITDVYTARASFDQSVAELITAQTQLLDDKENLRAITGRIYPDIATLSEEFPLISPQPSNIDSWVDTAQRQNWAIKSFQYASSASRSNIHQQFSGHLPTVTAQAQYNVNYNNYLGNTTPFYLIGSSQLKNKSLQLNVNIPLVQGGLVVARTHQAQYQYRVATQQLEQQVRHTINVTRQSYLGVIAGISKIKADKQTVKSTISSLEGMQAGYEVGTEILVNVLNQQQKVFRAQQIYAADRYAYVNDLLMLKQATGTLSPNDLVAINAWLVEPGQQKYQYKTKKSGAYSIIK